MIMLEYVHGPTQSLEKHNNLTFVSITGETAKESSDCCVHRYYDFEAQHHIQVLRVFYVQDPRISATNTRRHLINCMTFTPVQTTLGPNSTAAFEKMKQTMIRILAWINLAGEDSTNVTDLHNGSIHIFKLDTFLYIKIK